MRPCCICSDEHANNTPWCSEHCRAELAERVARRAGTVHKSMTKGFGRTKPYKRRDSNRGTHADAIDVSNRTARGVKELAAI